MTTVHRPQNFVLCGKHIQWNKKKKNSWLFAVKWVGNKYDHNAQWSVIQKQNARQKFQQK